MERETTSNKLTKYHTGRSGHWHNGNFKRENVSLLIVTQKSPNGSIILKQK